MSTVSLKTPLHAAHVRLGARLVEFAGYDMPVQYKGVIAESKAVRSGAGMFDVSHMARLTFTGDRVLEYLEFVTANDVAALANYQGQYSMLPNENGGLVDDIIVYRINAGEYRMVVNAANHEKDVAHLRKHNTHGVRMEDTTDRTAMIAVQGPNAAVTVAGMSDKPEEMVSVPFFSVVECNVAGVPSFCARSGYTGEDGYELICPAEGAERLWDALVAAGVEPCGLGARDVLRLEAGLPLYGHELSDDMNPIAAQLGWAIGKEKTFLGSGPIQHAREHGTPTKLRGVRLNGKRLPMPGMTVLVKGAPVGEVCSGVFSPTLDCGLAFAYIGSEVKLNTPCELDMRGKPEPGTIVGKRFLKGT
ncbi:MAG: glycine cleavage system aminomethyltransferase GcvT [Fimbriimonadaceae bacterium]